MSRGLKEVSGKQMECYWCIEPKSWLWENRGLFPCDFNIRADLDDSSSSSGSSGHNYCRPGNLWSPHTRPPAKRWHRMPLPIPQETKLETAVQLHTQNRGISFLWDLCGFMPTPPRNTKNPRQSFFQHNLECLSPIRNISRQSWP